MASASIPLIASSVQANTSAAANTLVYRDNQGGAAANEAWSQSLANDGAEFRSQTAVKTSAYTIVGPTNGVGGDRVVRCDPTGGGFNVTFPLASAYPNMVVTIKNVSASTNAITATRTGSDTFDGATSLAMTTARGSQSFQSDGVSDWYTV